MNRFAEFIDLYSFGYFVVRRLRLLTCTRALVFSFSVIVERCGSQSWPGAGRQELFKNYGVLDIKRFNS